MALANNIGDESREILAAQAHIWNHTFNFINSMSLKCAVQLGIPDVIHKHGQPMTLSQLVDALSINKDKSKDCIYRLMRILVHSGFFLETNVNETEEEKAYISTLNSRLLLKDEPLNLIPVVKFILDPTLMDSWHSLSKWFQNDDSTPFAAAHGKPLFEYAGDEPRLNSLFNEAMASDSRLVMSVVMKHCKGVFKGLQSLVDVGGSTGTVAKAIANEFPDLKCTVFDLPHVIEGLEGIKNLHYVGGDMFKSIPSTDAVLLKWILHNWSDEDCIQILKKCKEAISCKENGGKVIIIDMVLDNQNKSYENQLFLDMIMMVHLSGKQRSKYEWEKLFFNAGFSDYKIIPILESRSIIEVYL